MTTIAATLDIPADHVIDAAICYLLPGGVNPHTHLGSPRKGTIAVGSDADFVVFDPAGSTTIRAATHHMNVDYSLYEGGRLTGAVRTVIAAGRAIVDSGVFTGKPGAGRYLARDASGQL
ncbi:MAG: dihydropyrimidinase [Mycobacterium sp.]|nr:dihydropyrimidinase [Mycobacterium sp.]